MAYVWLAHYQYSSSRPIFIVNDISSLPIYNKINAKSENHEIFSKGMRNNDWY